MLSGHLGVVVCTALYVQRVCRSSNVCNWRAHPCPPIPLPCTLPTGPTCSGPVPSLTRSGGRHPTLPCCTGGCWAWRRRPLRQRAPTGDLRGAPAWLQLAIGACAAAPCTTLSVRCCLCPTPALLALEHSAANRCGASFIHACSASFSLPHLISWLNLHSKFCNAIYMRPFRPAAWCWRCCRT